MPPTVFFIAGAGLIGLVLAYLIMELARPWPDRKARRKKERRDAARARRHQEEDELIAKAAAASDQS